MVQVVLGEISRPPGPELEFAENRESYSLAAGLALGLITLGVSVARLRGSDIHRGESPYYFTSGLIFFILPKESIHREGGRDI